MVFYPKGLIVAALFVAALLLAINLRLGVTTGILALVAYLAIEMLGMGFASGTFGEGRPKGRSRTG
jgi:hypothetical protein